MDVLRDMVSDNNHTVVANAVAALVEIAEASNKDVFKMNADMLARLQTALDACTEWGQVSILDCLARYTPSAKDAEEIVERVAPRLKHANSAVALSAVKVIMKYLDIIRDDNLKQVVLAKLQPPLITLLSEQRPEIQYVALRNIRLIVQKRPQFLGNAVKHFFCKYNDPLYVKMEKLEVMIALANQDNIDKVLLEFKEYASEVDVDFVRKSVLAIGRCAIKLPSAADKCIVVLLSLIENKVNYVVQEAIIVIKDIFRKYPNKYETIISKLCDNLDTLDEPEAKSAMIWIVGEYGDRIDNSPQLLSDWCDNFEEESPQVQLQLLTAIVKVFLKNPSSVQDLVTRVLKLATVNSDNPDLRDRGYIYWRMLSTDPVAAAQVVLAKKELIEDDSAQLDSEVLDALIGQISTLSSIYHKLPETFVKDAKGTVTLRRSDGKEDEEDEEVGEGEEVEVEEEEDEQKSGTSGTTSGTSGGSTGTIDLLGLGSLDAIMNTTPTTSINTTTTAPSSSGATNLLDPLGLFMGTTSTSTSSTTTTTSPSSQQWHGTLSADKGEGLEIKARVERVKGTPSLVFQLRNTGGNTYNNPPVKFDKAYYNVVPANPTIPASLPPGATVTATLPLSYPDASLNTAAKSHTGLLRIAIKLNAVAYFAVDIPAEALFEENGIVTETKQWVQAWKTCPYEGTTTTIQLSSGLVASDDAVISRLSPINVKHLATRVMKDTNNKHMYFSAKWRHADVMIELMQSPIGAATLKVKTNDEAVAGIVTPAIVAKLQ